MLPEGDSAEDVRKSRARPRTRKPAQTGIACGNTMGFLGCLDTELHQVTPIFRQFLLDIIELNIATVRDKLPKH